MARQDKRWSPDTSVQLFPFDRTGRFRADVINHTVDALDLVDNPIGNDSQYFIWDAIPVGSHKVGCLYSTDGNNVFVTPFVSHDSYRAQRQEYGKTLCYGAVETCLTYLFNNNPVGIAKYFQSGLCYFT